MIEPNRVLQPLREAEGAIANLQDYQSTTELASAVQATHAAVQRSLRYLLRADKAAPDDIRLAALSPTEMAPERLIPALRQRSLISLELAGQLHELEQADRRASEGNVRAADADIAVRAVDQLHTEVQALGDRNVREVAHGTVADGALTLVHAVPLPDDSRRPMRLLLLAAVVTLVAVVSWLAFFHKSGTEKGIAQFNRRNYSAAEQTLSRSFDSHPGDAQAGYYLAILYRRSHQYDKAGQVLRRAVERNPLDPFLREEMGNLFMDLQHPELAVTQYRLAQQQDPKNTRYWVKLVTALRAARDPEADIVLQQAPDEARAMLRTGR